MRYRSRRTCPRRQPSGRPPVKDDERTSTLRAQGCADRRTRFAYVDDISCDIEQARVSYCDTRRSACPPSRCARAPTPVTLMAADILPSALLRDASQHLSHALLLCLSPVIRSYRNEARGTTRSGSGGVGAHNGCARGELQAESR